MAFRTGLGFCAVAPFLLSQEISPEFPVTTGPAAKEW